MSDLSDQLKSAMEKVMETTSNAKEVGFVDVTEDDTLNQIPGFEHALVYHKKQSVRAVNRAYRLCAGSAPFTEPREALEKTQESVNQEIVPALVAMLSDGIQMGQAQSFPYRKYELYNRLEEVFDKNAWRAESDLIGMPFQSDSECVDLISSMLLQTVFQLGQASGYTSYTGERLNKIWDLWALGAHSIGIGCFHAGYLIGKKWIEDTALNGILAATNAEENRG